MKHPVVSVLMLLLGMTAAWGSAVDPWLSKGRAPDSTEKRLAEIRASERRKIPLDVALVTNQDNYSRSGPIPVTIIVTNLFDPPLVLNSRMLINFPRLPGEVYFRILDPDGRPLRMKRLVTPLALSEEDFVRLTRGRSIQRTVDLADLYDITRKGTYILDVCYHNEVDQIVNNLRAWTGIVASDVVKIDVN